MLRPWTSTVSGATKRQRMPNLPLSLQCRPASCHNCAAKDPLRLSFEKSLRHKYERSSRKDMAWGSLSTHSQAQNCRGFWMVCLVLTDFIKHCQGPSKSIHLHLVQKAVSLQDTGIMNSAAWCFPIYIYYAIYITNHHHKWWMDHRELAMVTT